MWARISKERSMLSWVLELFTTSVAANPGPARNLFLPQELVAAKLSLKSPEVVATLRDMSLLDDICQTRQALRKTPPLAPARAYEPRHPVLRELLQRRARQ